MRSLFILTLFLSFTFNAFGQADSLATGNNILSGNWKLVEFKNLNTGKTADTASVQNGRLAFYKNVRIRFYDSVGLGEIWGKSFCNDVRAYYKVYKKNKLSISNFGGSKVDCLYEGKLWDAMRAASSYRRNDDTLFILYNHDSEEMLFIRDK